MKNYIVKWDNSKKELEEFTVKSKKILEIMMIHHWWKLLLFIGYGLIIYLIDSQEVKHGIIPFKKGSFNEFNKFCFMHVCKKRQFRK